MKQILSAGSIVIIFPLSSNGWLRYNHGIGDYQMATDFGEDCNTNTL